MLRQLIDRLEPLGTVQAQVVSGLAWLVNKASQHPGVQARLWNLEQCRAIDAHDFSSPNTVLVYQFGKVASTAILESLRREGYRCFQTHRLSDAGIEATRRYYRASGLNYLLPNLQTDLLLREKIAAAPPPVRIITLTREPVAHTLSVFLWHIDGQFDKATQLNRDRWPEILQRLVDRLESFDGDSDHHANWFDIELKQVFSVDVYATEFPHSEGHVILDNDRARVLVLRFEDLARAFALGVSALLAGARIPLLRTNTAEEHGRGDLNHYLKNNLRLSDAALERLYGTRYARHFYSEDERQRWKDRWSRKRPLSGAA